MIATHEDECAEGASLDHLDAATPDRPVRLKTPDMLGLKSWVATFAPGYHARRKSNDGVSPRPAVQLDEPADSQAGSVLLGFRLICELGRGAFGRVYLAQQGDLADREVVIKVSPTVEVESRILARLQHTNIVPIYSIHREGPLQIVCMPYFGSTTLAQVMKTLASSPSLPRSGEELLATVLARRSTLGEAVASEVIGSDKLAPALPSVDAPTEVLRALSYTDAILWMGARLADGLAHAHDRGILHRDIKPANILLTDDAQPMLLDFNLAQDTIRAADADAFAGGTLPFMAPEQLEAFRRNEPLLEASGDIYSLGVILYELLCGHPPFTACRVPTAEALRIMIEERRSSPRPMRLYNKSITPAVDAIIRHCLEPDPACRYHSARDLKEDLERQLEHRTLKHLPEPSFLERASKWMRRNPRLASMTTLVASCAVFVAVLVAMIFVREGRLAELDARAAYERFIEDGKEARYLLMSRNADAAQVTAGITSATELLGRYRILDDERWRAAASVRRLSPEDRIGLERAAGETMMLLSRGVALQAGSLDTPAEREDRFGDALAMNRRAESYIGTNSKALFLQRAEILRKLGKVDEAKAGAAHAEGLKMRTSADRYLVAAELVSKGRSQQAIDILADGREADPSDFWVCLLLGVCYDGLGRTGDAIACYDSCLAITPDSPYPAYNRGLARLRLGQYKRAVGDFDRALASRPGMAEALTNRAVARTALKEYAAAIRDLDRSLELGGDLNHVYFLRANAKEGAGNKEGARKDREAGLRREPADEKGWLSRAFSRMTAEPAAALADFDRALKFNPRSLPAMQNKAHVLSKLGRNPQAAAVLDAAAELFPDDVRVRAGRAVLRARMGLRAEAVEDAEASLALDRSPLTIYQLAGVYALTSKTEPADRKTAFRLLSAALQRGCGFELLEGDKDLDPVRDLPEFKKLVAAARAIREAPAESPPSR